MSDDNVVVGLHGNQPAENAPAPSSSVIPYSGITRFDLPPDQVLRRALEQKFDGVVILGFLAEGDGDLYFASTYADGGTVLWLLEKCKIALLDQARRREFGGPCTPDIPDAS